MGLPVGTFKLRLAEIGMSDSESDIGAEFSNRLIRARPPYRKMMHHLAVPWIRKFIKLFFFLYVLCLLWQVLSIYKLLHYKKFKKSRSTLLQKHVIMREI